MQHYERDGLRAEMKVESGGWAEIVILGGPGVGKTRLRKSLTARFEGISKSVVQGEDETSNSDLVRVKLSSKLTADEVWRGVVLELNAIRSFIDSERAHHNVVTLDDHRPHGVARMVCEHCGHRWVAVFDARADLLECSQCRLMSPPREATDDEWQSAGVVEQLRKAGYQNVSVEPNGDVTFAAPPDSEVLYVPPPDEGGHPYIPVLHEDGTLAAMAVGGMRITMPDAFALRKVHHGVGGPALSMAETEMFLRHWSGDLHSIWPIAKFYLKRWLRSLDW